MMVRSKMCKTCAFHDPEAEKNFAGAIARCVKADTFLSCHEADREINRSDQVIACRGFYEGGYSDTVRFLKKMGLVRFVPDEMYERFKKMWPAKRRRR